MSMPVAPKKFVGSEGGVCRRATRDSRRCHAHLSSVHLWRLKTRNGARTRQRAFDRERMATAGKGTLTGTLTGRGTPGGGFYGEGG